MSTRKDHRLMKFEVKRNGKSETLWAFVSKKALVAGYAKPDNYVSFNSSEDYWKILSVKRESIFNKPDPDERIYCGTSFKE